MLLKSLSEKQKPEKKVEEKDEWMGKKCDYKSQSTDEGEVAGI